MPLSVEFYHPDYQEWAPVSEVKPGQPPSYMPQFMPDGERKLYAIECDETDYFASISTYDIPEVVKDDEIGFINLERLDPKTVITVEKDHDCFISIKSDKEIERFVVKFSQT